MLYLLQKVLYTVYSICAPKKGYAMAEYEKQGYLNQDFRLFHLTDEKQRDFSYHYHDFSKIVIFIRGDVTYCVEGKSYELSPYDLVLVNTGEVHRPIVHSSRTYERIIVYISPDFLRSYKQADYDLGLCFIKSAHEKSNVLRIPSLKKSKLYQVCRELEASFLDTDYANELYRNILFLEFMILLNRAAAHNTLDFHVTADANDKILSVLAYLNEHLTDDISIDKLSELFFTSKYYLMHSFKAETGYTIGSYLSTKRLIHAKELIRGGMPVTQACYECGFKNYSTFSRAYKKNFGVPPTKQ